MFERILNHPKTETVVARWAVVQMRSRLATLERKLPFSEGHDYCARILPCIESSAFFLETAK